MRSVYMIFSIPPENTKRKSTYRSKSRRYINSNPITRNNICTKTIIHEWFISLCVDRKYLYRGNEIFKNSTCKRIVLL